MTDSGRLAGLAGSRGPGEVSSEILIIPHPARAHVTLNPQRGCGDTPVGMNEWDEIAKGEREITSNLRSLGF